MAIEDESISIHLVLKGKKWELIQDVAEELACMCLLHAQALEKGEAPCPYGEFGKPTGIVMMNAGDIECEIEVYGDALYTLTRYDYKEDLTP